MATRKLTIVLAGDDKSLKRTLDGTEKQVGGFGRKLGGVAVAVGAAFAGVGLARFGSSLMDVAAQAETSNLKINTVFEHQAEALRKWADKNNESFGLTSTQLGGLAADFGDLLKPMGFTADQATKMSKDVVGLSGALSQWSGGKRSAEEVSRMLGKAMLGEREGLQELGISISAADVKYRLLTKGQQDLTGASLAQAEAIATQELLFERSTDAQKAYAEGGNKTLLAMNEWRAGFAALREKLADKLIPVFLTVSAFLTETLVPAFKDVLKNVRDELTPAFKAISAFVTDTLVPAFKDIGAFVTDTLVPAFKDMYNIVKDNTDVVEALGIAIGIVLIPKLVAMTVAAAAAAVAMAAVGVAMVLAKLPLVLLVGAIALLVLGVKHAYENFGWFRNIVNTVARFFTDTLWPALKNVGSWITDTLIPIIGDIIGKFGEWIGKGAEVVTTIVTKFGGLVEFITGLPRRIANAARGMWDGITDAFRTAINFVIRGWNSLSFTLPAFGPFKGATLAVPRIAELRAPTGPEERHAYVHGVRVLHTGGIFHAGPRREGLAMLRDGEGVFTPAQMAALGPRGPAINIENVYLGTGGPRELADELAWMWRVSG